MSNRLVKQIQSNVATRESNLNHPFLSILFRLKYLILLFSLLISIGAQAQLDIGTGFYNGQIFATYPGYTTNATVAGPIDGVLNGNNFRITFGQTGLYNFNNQTPGVGASVYGPHYAPNFGTLTTSGWPSTGIRTIDMAYFPGGSAGYTNIAFTSSLAIGSMMHVIDVETTEDLVFEFLNASGAVLPIAGNVKAVRVSPASESPAVYSNPTANQIRLDGATNISLDPGWTFVMLTDQIRSIRFQQLAETSGAPNHSYDFTFSTSALDYGDAPASYGSPSTISFANLLRSGTVGADQEVTTVPSTGANTDDAVTGNAIDDENTIGAINVNTSSTSYTLPSITTFNNSASFAVPPSSTIANVYAWIDWDRDGSFEANEFVSTTVANSTVAQSISLPAWAGLASTIPINPGSSYIRIRITTDVLSDNVGTALVDERSISFSQDGEVEDYPITISIASISGTIFNDPNGLTDNLVNGTGTNAGGLNAVLVDNTTGNVVATSAVGSTGTYNLVGVITNNYRVIITTNTATVGSAPPAIALPSGWTNTGEFEGTVAGNDGTVNGLLPIGVVSTSRINVNFGIDRTPETTPFSTFISTPTSNQFVTLNGGANPPIFSGSDPEDQPAAGVLTAKKVAITSLPANGQIWYNNVRITLGVDGTNPPSLSNPFIINNFDPNLMQVRVTGSGYNSILFNYSYIDAADKIDLTPATYEVKWLGVLPVRLLSFNGERKNSKNLLSWKTSDEINFKEYLLERSIDGINYNVISTIPAKGATSNNYEYSDDYAASSGIIYYRLKQIDIDGKFQYSNIVVVKLKIEHLEFSISPNPVTGPLLLTIFSSNNTRVVVIVNDVLGKTVLKQDLILNTGINNINIQNKNSLINGTYFLRIVTKGIEKTSKFVVQR